MSFKEGRLLYRRTNSIYVTHFYMFVSMNEKGWIYNGDLDHLPLRLESRKFMAQYWARKFMVCNINQLLVCYYKLIVCIRPIAITTRTLIN